MRITTRFQFGQHASALAIVSSVLLFCSSAQAEQISVMISGGFAAAYETLAPKFEKATSNTLSTVRGPSMGDSPEAIPNRLQRGEQADVVIMVGYALDGLIKQGTIVPDSRRDLADSRIGMVVKAGSPKPDISTVEAFKNTLLNAKSIAYSDSASGVYFETKLLKRLGIEEQVKGKSHKLPKLPVASVVASGEYELGFQQVSELLPVKGVDFVGKIPEPVQSVTTFAAGIPVGAKHPADAKALINFLSSPAAAADVKQSGLELIAPASTK